MTKLRPWAWPCGGEAKQLRFKQLLNITSWIIDSPCSHQADAGLYLQSVTRPIKP